MLKFVLALTAALMAFSVACGDDDDDATAPTTAPASASSEPSGTAGLKEFASEKSPLGVTMTADDSWSIDYDGAEDFALKHNGDATYPTGYIEVFVPTAVYADDGLTTEAVPDDLADWIRTYPRLTQQGETAVTVGGLSGVQFDVASEGDAGFRLFQLAPDNNYGMGYSDRVRLTVLEGSTGHIVIAEGAEPAPRITDFLAVADPVVASIEFANP